MIVKVQQGVLKGKECESVLTGCVFYCFLGIPYAQPPIGRLRFQPPVEPEAWDGTLNATEDGTPCTQWDYETQKPIGNENCLFLNVYTPKQVDEHLKAVMVYIHGGGYITGSGNRDLYAPDYIINHDVILVTINYRLNAFGFLNLGLPECPGNVGMKDQVMALKWIKGNIRSFGGDCENITIFGQSAGGSSVHLHMISPLSKGLFHKSIMQSGSYLASWAFFGDAQKLNDGVVEFGKLVGYNGTCKNEMLKFLMSVSGERLAYASYITGKKMLEKYPELIYDMCFGPSVEEIKDGAFLPQHPNLLADNMERMPVMVGLVESEMESLFTEDTPLELAYKTINNSFSSLIEFNIQNMRKNQISESTEKIKKLYFGEKVANSETYKETVDLCSDLSFTIPFYEMVNDFSTRNHPIYLYLFTFVGKLNLGNLLNPEKEYKKATHGDELSYLFYGNGYKINSNFLKNDEAAEIRVIKNMCKFWTNFAKKGNPNDATTNANWSSSSLNHPSYLQIDYDLIPRKGKIFEKRLSWWGSYQ